jgi:phosphoribosylaminoimidazole carboxylase
MGLHCNALVVMNLTLALTLLPTPHSPTQGNMGVRLRCLDPSEDAPAAVAADHVQGHFRDADAIAQFAAGCDVLTVEIEHIDADALEAVSRQLGIDVEPTPSTVRTIQDKYAQKVHFQAAGVPLGAFADAPNKDALLKVASEFGYPLMLKSKRWVGCPAALVSVELYGLPT